MNLEKLEKHACHIRKNCISMVYKAKSGHIGGSLSSADILTYLYFEEMNINAQNVDTINRDRFVLGKGHASPLLYSVLKEKGLMNENLMTFRQIDSKLQGHPNMNYIEAVDMSTGSLGQGISCAVGMALANKIKKNEHRVYALLGDGECEEGQVWEAITAAHHYHLNNLCAILDYNGLQIDGAIENIISPAPFKEKIEAFGWNVVEIDGHDFESIADGFGKAKECIDRPTFLIAKTIKGKGVSYMENNCAWHGTVPNDEQYNQAIKELGGK